MQLTFEPARLTGFAILALAGATALSVGACSSSHDEKSPATSSPASAKGKVEVHGLIASVSGNAVQVTQTTGTATVDVSPSTRVTENSKAQLTDLVRRAEAGDEVILTRHGHGAVVLVPFHPVPAAPSRRALLEAVRASGTAKAAAGPDAARSQDFLYGDDGLPQ